MPELAVMDTLTNTYLSTPYALYTAVSSKPENLRRTVNKYREKTIEKITLLKKVEVTDPDSLIFSYTDRPMPFSLINGSVISKKLNLFKFEIKWGKIDFNGAIFPSRVFSFEASKVAVPDPEKIKILIEKFEKDCKSAQH